MLHNDIFIDDYQNPPEVVASVSTYRRGRRNSTVCSIEAVDNIYNGRGLLSVSVAGIYRVEFSDGSNSEILVMGNQQERDFGRAYFLEKGRSSDQLSEVLKLLIQGEAGAVPEAIKTMLYNYNIGLHTKEKNYYGA